MANEVTIMSNGMGVESTAILLRWIMEPDTRPCPLEDLVTVTSQVGDEYRDTLADFDTHMLPLFRANNMRLVQVARAGHLEEEGIVVLEDSRQPTRMMGEGCYKLSDELRSAGTLPQFGGEHTCSLKFKAFVIETWIEANIKADTVKHAFGYNLNEDTRVTKSDEGIAKRMAKLRKQTESKRKAQAKRHAAKGVGAHRIAFGFNVDEAPRYERAAAYDIPTRIGFYPLVEWGWTREDCLNYIERHLGIRWSKSACVYCPFAHNKQGQAELVARHKRHPEQVADALMLENVALSLNPRQTLYAVDSLVQITTEAGNSEALAGFQKRLQDSTWAVYHVRRIYKESTTTPGAKGMADRCVQRIFNYDTKREAQHFLEILTANAKLMPDEARGIKYAYRHHRGESWPTTEEYYVAAPATVGDKVRYTIPKFNAQWAEFHQ